MLSVIMTQQLTISKQTFLNDAVPKCNSSQAHLITSDGATHAVKHNKSGKSAVSQPCLGKTVTVITVYYHFYTTDNNSTPNPHNH